MPRSELDDEGGQGGGSHGARRRGRLVAANGGRDADVPPTIGAGEDDV